MEYLFALYIVALLGIFFIGFLAVRDVVNKPKSSVDRIANLQHWEYLRSLKKDGFE